MVQSFQDQHLKTVQVTNLKVFGEKGPKLEKIVKASKIRQPKTITCLLSESAGLTQEAQVYIKTQKLICQKFSFPKSQQSCGPQ